MSVHVAISRTAASRAHPAWGLFGWVKSRSIIAACILLLDSGRKRAWGNRGLSAAVPKNDGVSSGWQSSRAPWSHALHGKQQQQQQREKSRRDQV